MTEQEPTPLPSKRQIGLLTLTILLFLLGMLVAPEPLENGEYDVTITYSSDEHFIQVDFGIILTDNINQPSNLQSVNKTVGGKTIVVWYYPQYEGIVNNKIKFVISLFEVDAQIHIKDINSFSGKLVGENNEIDISPTSSTKTQVEFEFRVLKFTKLALGLLLAISFLWLTELVPLAASSLLIPVILVVFNVEGASSALSEFSNPIIFLFLAGFLLAEAMKRSGLDTYISVKILSIVPPNAKLILFSLMALSAIFSMFMSNTAAAAVLIPLSIQLVDSIELKDNKYKKTVVLGIAYSATIGGIGSLIGTPPNIIATEFLREFNPDLDISFAMWFLFGLPIVIVMLPITFLHLWLRFKPVVNNDKLASIKDESIEKMKNGGGLTGDQIIVSIIFVLIFILWLTTEIHGISASIVALAGAIALFFTGQIDESDLNKINWSALLTFGGGLTLGNTILRTGLADWLAMKLNLIGQFPQLVILFIIGFLALLLTAVASNTASASILIPIVMPLGVILGISPVVLAVYVAIVCSIDFAIVIGTPPTMVAYSTGQFKVQEIFKTGIVLDIIGLIVTTILANFIMMSLVKLV